MTSIDITKSEYTGLMGLLESTSAESPVSMDREVFEAVTAFAKAKKLKRPDVSKVKFFDDEVKPTKPTKPAKEKAEKKPSNRVKNAGETCKADGCDRPAVAKGYCSKHYQQEYRKTEEHAEAARKASREYQARQRAAAKAETKA